MLRVQLARQYFPTHTFGILLGLSKPIHTIERPWQDNAQKVSCIPEGTYVVQWREAHWSRFPRAFQIMEVPGRAGILIHSANLARQLQGCIAPGLNRGVLQGEPAVLNSVLAIAFLESQLPKKFILEIRSLK